MTRGKIIRTILLIVSILVIFSVTLMYLSEPGSVEKEILQVVGFVFSGLYILLILIELISHINPKKEEKNS